MRKVVLYQLLSLDGVAEEPGDWMFDGGQPIFDNLDRVIQEQDLVLFGRRTYDYWVDFWPQDGPEPFHTFINETPKHVFTSSPLEKEWSNTTLVDRPAADHVRKLRHTDGNSIGIHGSITLARSLIHAGLVDELRLVVAATLAGKGERLFDGADELRRLELLDSESTPGGSLLLGYRVQPAD